MDSEHKEGFDQHDPLWDVLGHASKPPAPSPYFSRRVLRDLDAGKAPEADLGWFAQMRWSRSWMPIAATIAILMTAGYALLPTVSRGPGSEVLMASDDTLLPVNPEQRISVVLADLDELIAFEDNQIGDDESMWQ